MGEMGKDLNIDWSKFKVKVVGVKLVGVQKSYIDFCKILDETDFKLVGNYIGSQEKVELIYKHSKDIKLNIIPKNFKNATYIRIVNFKNKLKENGDEFMRFVGLTNKNNLVAKIKTVDGGIVDIDIAKYNSFIKARRDFYDKLKEVNGSVKHYYKDAKDRINIHIDSVKLNLISVHTFKTQTYKAIINFKNELKKNNDEFIKFIRLGGKNTLVAKIKTLDNGNVNININSYNSFNKSRQSMHAYCNSKGYKSLSPYIGNNRKMLIDFNCGHNPHWINIYHLKNNQGCPICSESKGEKTIRQCLENNNISFIQEYKFKDCKYKKQLPFDFYIPEYNLCIEFDGEQHFKANNFFREESFKDTQKRDKIKNDYCKNNGINLLRIPYWEMDNIEGILDEEFERLREGFIENNIA